MRLLLSLAVISLLFTSVPAFAGANETAREIAKAAMSRESWDDLMKKTAQDTEVALLSQLGNDPEVRERISTTFRKLMSEVMSYEEYLDLQMALLVKYYDEAELKEVLALYRTPLGQKMIRVLPEMSRDVNAEMVTRVQRMISRTLQPDESTQTAPVPAPVKTKKSAPVKGKVPAIRDAK